MIHGALKYAAPALVLIWTGVLELIGYSLTVGILAAFSIAGACKPYWDELIYQLRERL